MAVISGTPLITHSGRPVPQCTEYKITTQHYLLPILSGIGTPGGPIAKSSICEKRWGDIVDRQLQGAINVHDPDGGIFEEGAFEFDEDTNLITLNDFRAFINGVYVENLSDEPVVWIIEEADLNRDQYLILGLIEEADGGRDDFESSRIFGEFTGRTSDAPDPGTDEIVIAMRTNSGVLTTSVPNRQSFTSLENHVIDDSPHGGLWIQDEAIVSGIDIRDRFTVVKDGDATVTLSGVFVPPISTIPGQVLMNDDLILSGFGGSITGVKLLNDDVQVFEKLLEVRDEFGSPEMIVESGMSIFSQTRIHDHWIFSDDRSEEGVGYRLVRGDESFGTKTSDGEGFVLFDPSVYGKELDTHVGDFNNPHRLIASGITPYSLNVLSIFGDTAKGHIDTLSGIALDGIDFSTLNPLIDGSNADALHRHLLLENIEYQFFAPEYPHSIVSGVQLGFLETTYKEDQDRTQLSWFALQQLAEAQVVITPPVPEGHQFIEDVIFFSRVSSGIGIQSAVSFRVYDTEGDEIMGVHHLRRQASLRGGTLISGVPGAGVWTEGEKYRMEIDLISELGIGAHASDIIVRWRT